jgi:CheY-like chemotaxis protein
METDSVISANTSAESHQIEPGSGSSDPVPHRSSVLIADGNPNTAPMLPAALRDLGHDVFTVPLPFFVQSVAMQRKPAALIVGTNLPKGGPATVVGGLRAHVETAAIPVIALTAPGDKEALLSAGVDRCLDLPVSDPDIVVALQAHLGKPHFVAGAPAAIIRHPERLAALEAMHILDTDPEADLDVLTLLAARILNVPVALVSLVDHRRQFFKSAVGLQPPWDELRETPVADSFCQWVVSSSDGLVVADARTHPVLMSNHAISDLGVIAYLGVPLSAPSGETIGSFCAVDARPHAWQEEEVAAMRDLAQLVDAHISLYSPLPPERPSEHRQKYIRAATRAAGRGVFGAAHLVRSSRKLLSDADRAEILSLVERQSCKLVDIAAELPQAQ